MVNVFSAHIRTRDGNDQMERIHSRFHRFSSQERIIYLSVNSVVPNEDFTLTIGFGNGESGVLDMKSHLGFGVFRLLADNEQFKQVRVSFDTLEWDSGADLDPEFVYARCGMTTETL